MRYHLFTYNPRRPTHPLVWSGKEVPFIYLYNPRRPTHHWYGMDEVSFIYLQPVVDPPIGMERYEVPFIYLQPTSTHSPIGMEQRMGPLYLQPTSTQFHPLMERKRYHLFTYNPRRPLTHWYGAV
ncbi:hypothetical protein AVEN_97845-1 [Araneus ventricosus]|uniref:Uncharacterized protein n=1 Tax=Araneus ventricosus TaxID=182803 RepID=A0A4Y2RLW2_ARAVE|nr:hypothetical protein AVEN_97845-1 [Araneus ventricosus]